MGLKSAVSAAGRWLWNTVKSVAKKGQTELLDDVKAIAMVVVEDVANSDVNGDGRVSAALEVVDAAKALGLKWGNKLLADGQNEAYNYLESLQDHDFKRYLSLARVSVQVAKRFGLDKTPTTHILLGVIQAVLGEAE
jgi:hypothetical protein